MEILIKVIVIVLTAGIVLLGFKYLTKKARKTAIRTVKKERNLIIKILVVIVACSIALFLTNTVTKTAGKDSYINNFENFIEEVKIDHEEYSKTEWKDIETEYLDLSEKKRLIYEDLLTKEDKKRLSRLEGQYLSYRTSGFIDNIMKTTKDVFINAVEYIDGFMEAEEIEVEDEIDKIISNNLNNELVNDTINE